MRKSVLIIEESTSELLKLRKLFSNEGYEIMTATDLETANEICKKIDLNYVLCTRSAWKINTINKQGEKNVLY